MAGMRGTPSRPAVAQDVRHSKVGRDNGRASAGHLPQKVERACHLANRADGDAGC